MSGHKSYKRDDLGDSAYETGPSLAQLRAAERRNNFDQRFGGPLGGGPLGFKQQKFRKLRFWNKYPRTWVYGFSTVSVCLFFSKPLYDAFIRQPTELELKRSEYLKQKAIKKGWGWLYFLD